MSTQLRNEELVSIHYYHIDGYVENEDNIDTIAFETSHYGVTKINFFDKDLFLGSTPHKQTLFIIVYIHKYRVNRILIDDGSTINIFLLKK